MIRQLTEEERAELYRKMCAKPNQWMNQTSLSRKKLSQSGESSEKKGIE